MIRFLLLIQFIIYLLFTFSCKTNVKVIHKNIVAKYGNTSIVIEDLDSLTRQQVYNLKLNVLETYLEKQLLVYHSQNLGISLNQLINDEINKKANQTLTKEYKYKYLKQRQSEFIDSLKHLYNAKIMYKPQSFDQLDVSNLFSLPLSGSNHNQVFIISSFNCSACKNISKELSKIIENHSEHIEFRYISFSDYFDIFDKAIVAAGQQNMAFDFYKFTTEKSLYSDTNLVYQFLAETEICKEDFLNELDDKSNLLMLLKTKDELISKGIYSTPTFIVNNKILDGRYAINYLENIIKDEFNCN